ncbi:MAG: sulfite exporter TauE/SafE family protein [Acidipila sp.]|nr:sulfite exporter TauE/SafE family protein [Acidipila sp.]
MSGLDALFLLFAGVLAGAINAVAGGGSFVAFPALLFTGLAEIPANATNTVAMWVGIAASGGAYRGRLNTSRRVLIPLILTSVAGGLAGALLLVKTPAHTFVVILPWLMLGATLLFTFGRHLTGRLRSSLSRDASNAALAGASCFEFLVAIYGGYFGGGMGIMNLAMFAALGMNDIHEMNALKVVLSGVINGMATITFIAAGIIDWPRAGVMAVGAIAGGYAGAHFAQKLPQSWIRYMVVAVGFSMTIYFFARAYR